MLACIIEKEHKARILIIDTDYLNKSIHEIFGTKKQDIPIRYKKTNIYILTLESLDKIKQILKYKMMFDLVILDTSSFENYTEEILQLSDKNIFITESSLISISKLKKLLNKLNIKEKNEKNFILFNKLTKNAMDKNILKHIFFELSYLSSLDYKENIEKYINKQNLYARILDSNEKKKYIKIINKLFKIKKKNKSYCFSKLSFK